MIDAKTYNKRYQDLPINQIIQSWYNDIYNYNGGVIGIYETAQLLNEYLGNTKEIQENNNYFKQFLKTIHNDSSLLIGSKNHLHLFINDGLTGLAYSIIQFLTKGKAPLIFSFRNR